MFNIGGSEILVILVIALLFLGPDKLPEAAKTLSKGIRDLKKQSRVLQETIENDEHIGGAIRDLKSALRGDEIAPRPIKKPRPKPEIQPGDEVVKVVGPVAPPALAAVAAAAEATPGATAAAATPPAADGEATHDEADDDEPAKPAVRLPPMAGEADPGTPADASDDDELASLIRPAAGTVAKGATDDAAAPEPAKQHG